MLRHELREGNWPQLSSCRLYNTALSRAFQLLLNNNLRSSPGTCRAQQLISGSPNHVVWVSFPAPAIYNRQFQNSLSE
jgi:hypothetical protein